VNCGFHQFPQQALPEEVVRHTSTEEKKIYMHFYSNMKYRVFDGTLYERPKLIPRGLQEMHGKNIYIKRSM